jgi:hypothetical protein
MKKVNVEEEIIFAITEETIESEAEQELGRELTQRELKAVVEEIESEAMPIFDFIRACIRKAVNE